MKAWQSQTNQKKEPGKAKLCLWLLCASALISTFSVRSHSLGQSKNNGLTAFPDHYRINRFRDDRLKYVLKELFSQAVLLLDYCRKLTTSENLQQGTKESLGFNKKSNFPKDPKK